MRINAWLAAAALASTIAAPAAGQDVKYGDDSGQYPFDGECDDRRFRGAGMAGALTWSDVGRDATDCEAALRAGRADIWRLEDARAATQCARIQWGNDSSDYALDGECDDPRLEGHGMASHVVETEKGRDATDCRRLCDYGLIFLRDY